MLKAAIHRVAVHFARDARTFSQLICAAALLFLAGCAHNGGTRVATPRPARIGTTETGIASWYGPNYDGRRAASGEIFDQEKLTAAHKKLPFETWVEVTNLTNGKHVDVRITDRGPFVKGRIIDLSLAAAREIDMVRAGIVRVRLKVIRPPTLRTDTGTTAPPPESDSSTH